MNFKSKVATAFGVASVMLIGVGALSYRRMVQTSEDEKWVAHTFLVRDELETLLYDFAASDAAQRAYVITDDQSYLPRDRDMRSRIRLHAEKIRDLTTDNIVQQISSQQLDPLVTARLAEMESMLAVRREGSSLVETAQRVNRGAKTSAQIRTLVLKMIGEEDHLLMLRTTAASASSQKMRGIILFGYATAFIFLFAASLVIHREMQNRRRAETEALLRSAELQTVNKELESFCYSVAHDLRAPLRGIDGFSQAVLEDYSGQIDESGKGYLQRIRSASQRMAILIDDLLNLSRITRTEMRKERVDLSEIARAVAEGLRESQPERDVQFVIAPKLAADGDPRLMRVVLENLLGNSWKFTSKQEKSRVEFGRTSNGSVAFYVKDNGAGFDPAHASRLFGAFQRLHAMNEFPGTGVGLATVQRIIHRHGGRVWAESAAGKGATFYFTL